jgi:hypothetical protein
MILAFALAAAIATTTTDAVPVQYQIHATMIQDGKVVYDPRLLSHAGETATFVVGGHGTTDYDLKVTATPDARHHAGPDGVSLAVDLMVGRQGSNRHVLTTVVVKSGEPVHLTLPASATDPAVTVDISADKV